MNSPDLAQPTRYFPLEKGLYEVAPGLRALGSELTFEIDTAFSKARTNRIECRNERLSKYYGIHEYTAKVSSAVNQFLVERIARDQPRHFKLESGPLGSWAFHALLTGETLHLDPDYELIEVRGSSPPHPPYANAFDALCSQVQEDVAILSTAPGGRDWLSSIHLCSPSHWSAEDKLGMSFFEIHAPVPGIEKLNRAAPAFVDAMIHKGPYSRFVWGFGSDSRLNHHPEPPPGVDPVHWKGRSFNASRAGSPFILRVERQVLNGLPAVEASVFTIRVSFINGEEIRSNPRERDLLRSALLSMTPESRVYKGLSECMDQVISWLDQAAASPR